ncbi:MAG TPA: hypothetical protein VMW18_14735 [Candidatus Binatia bacterium]|nr:hypothetical protein [Candidatus Binatia bacterium]
MPESRPPRLQQRSRARAIALAVRRPGFRRRRPERWDAPEVRHRFRLWVLGTLAMMILIGGMAGSLLRNDLDGDLGGDLGGAPVAVVLVLLPLLALMALWFRRGYRLWRATRFG